MKKRKTIFPRMREVGQCLSRLPFQTYSQVLDEEELGVDEALREGEDARLSRKKEALSRLDNRDCLTRMSLVDCWRWA